MNCDCFKKTEEKIQDMGNYEKRKIESVSTKNMMYTFGTNGGESGTLSYEEFEVELEGLKNPKILKVAHTYCPFCGVKTGKLDSSQPDNNPLEI